MNIQHFNYQRNGVAANPFYSLITDTIPHINAKGTYIVTFEAQPNDSGIDISTVRVVEANNPTKSWRGDETGFALSDLFSESKFRTIWEWKESLKY